MKVTKSGECQKLSSGTLTYELGTEDGEQYIRVAANPGGGRFSNEWVPVKKIEELLAKAGSEFSSTIFREVFVSKSTNNAGFLAAILKAENVIGQAGKKLTQKTGGGPGKKAADASTRANTKKAD